MKPKYINGTRRSILRGVASWPPIKWTVKDSVILLSVSQRLQFALVISPQKLEIGAPFVTDVTFSKEKT
jgi:hypothetical protein